MSVRLRTVIVMVVAFLIVPFLADLHIPFGSLGEGIAYAKGDCYRLTAIIRRLGATGKTPKWKEVVRALGGGL